MTRTTSQRYFYSIQDRTTLLRKNVQMTVFDSLLFRTLHQFCSWLLILFQQKQQTPMIKWKSRNCRLSISEMLLYSIPELQINFKEECDTISQELINRFNLFAKIIYYSQHTLFMLFSELFWLFLFNPCCNFQKKINPRSNCTKY